MCLAMPVLVLELTADDQAVVDLGGIKKEISLALVEGVQPGDYVILHAGYALQKLDREEADRTLALAPNRRTAQACDRRQAQGDQAEGRISNIANLLPCSFDPARIRGANNEHLAKDRSYCGM